MVWINQLSIIYGSLLELCFCSTIILKCTYLSIISTHCSTTINDNHSHTATALSEILNPKRTKCGQYSGTNGNQQHIYFSTFLFIPLFEETHLCKTAGQGYGISRGGSTQSISQFHLLSGETEFRDQLLKGISRCSMRRYIPG